MAKLSKRHPYFHPHRAAVARPSTAPSSTLINKYHESALWVRSNTGRVRFKWSSRVLPWRTAIVRKVRAAFGRPTSSRSGSVRHISRVPTPSRALSPELQRATATLARLSSSAARNHDSPLSLDLSETWSPQWPADEKIDVSSCAHASKLAFDRDSAAASWRSTAGMDSVALRKQVLLLQNKVTSEEAMITALRADIRSLEVSLQTANKRYLDVLRDNRALREGKAATSSDHIAPRPVQSPAHRRDSPGVDARLDADVHRTYSVPPVARSAQLAKAKNEAERVLQQQRHHSVPSAIPCLQRETHGFKPGAQSRPSTADSNKSSGFPNPWDPLAKQALAESIDKMLSQEDLRMRQWHSSQSTLALSDAGLDSSASTTSTAPSTPVRTPFEEKFFDAKAFADRKLSFEKAGDAFNLEAPALQIVSTDGSPGSRSYPVHEELHSVLGSLPPKPSTSPTSIYSFRPSMAPGGLKVVNTDAPSMESLRPVVPLRSAKRLPKSPRAMALAASSSTLSLQETE